MAKKNKKSPNSSSKEKGKKSKAAILEEIEAMSSSDEGSVDNKNKAWNAKADALKKAIKDGDFEKILTKGKSEEDDDSVEEIVLGEDDDNDEDDNDEESSEEDKPDVESESEVEEDKKAEVGKDQQINDESDDDSENDHENEKDDDDDEEEEEQYDALYDSNSKALIAKVNELVAEKKDFSWVETFDIVSSTPLPFGQKDAETGVKIDIHDDLKREVAFYNMALEAVEDARMKCKESNVPFTRPDDFFAEMVKSDDHMARIKDRLIFENKKIEAVTQRKSNREQKLRSKEAHANKIAEKSKRRKDNVKAVDEWAKSAAANRGGRYSDDADQKYLKKFEGGDQKRPWKDRDGNYQTGPNKKRMNADKKYGFGGKRGRFKQNTQADINDMSGFNPRGNFSGGSKRKGGGAGAGRQGKRARDASRQRS